MAKYTERDFRVGDYYLSQRGRKGAWFRTFYDAAAKQTRRVSLGTEDFSEAKERLTEWFIVNVHKQGQQTSKVLLDEVILAYYHQHAVNVRAGSRIKYQLGHIQSFFDGMTVEEACNPKNIERFQQHLLGLKLKPSYINNILIIIRAAINRAWKRGELDKQFFISSVKEGASEPKGTPLKPSEIATLFDAAGKHVQAMIMLGIGTGARPEAVCELKWEQIDFEAGIIDLNPRGRAQTNKHRPTVKMAPLLREWLEQQPRACDYVVHWRAKPIHRYSAAWKLAKTNSGLEGTISPYSLRHTVARWCRMKGVPMEEIASFLGHKVAGRSITERYVSYSPDYQVKACAAVNELLAEIASCRSRAASSKKMAA